MKIAHALALIAFLLPRLAAADEHPRLLFGKDDLPALKARAAHPQLKDVARRLLEQADHALSALPILVSLSRRGDPDPPGETKGLAAARTLQSRVVSLCMAFTLTGERKYRDAAVRELDHALSQWKIWVDTAHSPPFDLMTGETCATFGIAYDWLHPDLSPQERTRLREGAERRGLDPYLAAAAQPMRWVKGKNNWNPVCNGGAALLALALEGESDRSSRVVDAAVEGMQSYWNHLGDDGGCEEGTGYWTYGNRYGLLAAEALRRREKPGGREVFERPGVRRMGYFPLVFNPGPTLSASFGDVAIRASDPIFYLLAREYRNGAFVWFQDRAAGRSPWPREALTLLWRPVDEPWLPEANPSFKPEIDAVASFPSVGWAMMAPAQPDPPFFLAFKNGSLAAGHTHLDLNHVTVAVGETMLLTELGSRAYPADYFGSRRYTYYELTTAGHNTVLIGGKGQVYKKPGALTGPVTGPRYEAFVGSAAGAYETPVTRARRTVVFVDRRYWVLLDDVATPEPQPVELRFHTGGRVKREGETWIFEDHGASLALASGWTGELESPAGWIRPVTVLSLKSAKDSTAFAVPTVVYPLLGAPPPPVTFLAEGEALRVRVGPDSIRFRLAPEGWVLAAIE